MSFDEISMQGSCCGRMPLGRPVMSVPGNPSEKVECPLFSKVRRRIFTAEAQRTADAGERQRRYGTDGGKMTKSEIYPSVAGPNDE